MRKSRLSSGLFLGSTAFLGWAQSTGSTDAGMFSRQEWAVINTLSPLPALPVDTTNKYRDSAAAALLGQKLFFEPRLSGPIQAGTPAEGQLGAIGEKYKIACRNCHMPESRWLFDIRSNNGGPIPNATALGSAWMTRNVSSIVNTVFYVHAKSGAHWRENDGYSDSEWFDAQSEPEGPPVQNGSRLQLAHVIFEHYRADYNAAFPDWPLDSGPRRLQALPGDRLAVHRRRQLERPSRRRSRRSSTACWSTTARRWRPISASWSAGTRRSTASSPATTTPSATDAKHGLKLFLGKAGCVHCHNTPLLSDDDFHVIGLKIDTTLSPHADPTEIGRVFNQPLICDPNVAGGDFNVNGHFSDDPTTSRDGDFCSQTIPEGLWRTKGLRQSPRRRPTSATGRLRRSTT